MEAFANPPGGLNPQEVEAQGDQEDPLEDRQEQAGDAGQEEDGAGDASQSSKHCSFHRMPPGSDRNLFQKPLSPWERAGGGLSPLTPLPRGEGLWNL